MNAPVDAVKNYFNMDPRQLDYYKHTQLEKKAVDLIIEKGSVTEVEPEAVAEDPSVKDEKPSEPAED
jgi:trigger factor